MLLIGHSASRRTTLLRNALEQRGLQLAVVDWHDILADNDVLPQALDRGEHRWCKIDSPGENAITAAALITRGWHSRTHDGSPPAELLHGELACQHLWFDGFGQVLRRIGMQLDAASHAPRLLNSIDEILTMTDKWKCQHHLQEHGIAIPPLLTEIRSFDAFDAAFPASDWPRVFIKARYGSSAAGVLALQRHTDGRVSAMSSARMDSHGRVFNHLRVAHYRRRDEIAGLIDALAEQGAYAEGWIAKPRAPTAPRSCYDLRVVASVGRARQRVARLSETPMTNLHLGNQRAAPDWLEAQAIAAVEQAVVLAAQAFGASHNVGFDLIGKGVQVHMLEANAFGDLLPGLLYAGQDTYADQAELAARDER